MRNGISFRRLWGLCPGRHILLLVSMAWVLFYFLFRWNRGWMNALCRVLVRPWHQFAGRLSSVVSFSLAEWLLALALIAAGFFVWKLVREVRRRRWGQLYRWGITLLSVASFVFGLFCLWWGVYYYSDSFQRQSGLVAQPISSQALEETTAYFAKLANAANQEIQRDEEGLYTADLTDIFHRSQTLYHAVAEKFPCLQGPDTRPKPILLSRGLSYLKTTGFFFAYTAEANINVDAPLYTIPSTIAHELAHQRGVAREDEANFVAVLSSLESGDKDFVYSAAMMAYTYLGNALYRTDYEAWYRVYMSLDEAVRQDLRSSNLYWQQFDTPVAEMSETVYEGFLRTYGDDRGMQSYGACVDLLVAYYGPDGRAIELQ